MLPGLSSRLLTDQRQAEALFQNAKIRINEGKAKKQRK